jgi:hypothetical protein
MGLTAEQAAYVVANPGLFGDPAVYSDPAGLGGVPGGYTTVGPSASDFGDSPGNTTGGDGAVSGPGPGAGGGQEGTEAP